MGPRIAKEFIKFYGKKKKKKRERKRPRSIRKKATF